MPKVKSRKTTKKQKVKAVKSSTKKGSKSPTKKKTSTKTAAVRSKPRRTVTKTKKVTPAVSQKTAKPQTKQKRGTTLREKRVQDIKTILLKQKESLLNEAEVALNELPGQTIFPDLGDQASAETDRSFMLKLRGREQRLLQKIDEALDRIENGTFGICDDCGEEIDFKRLEARPVTTMCIACKTLQEEEEKLRAT